MKKLVITLLVLCLLFAAALGYFGNRNGEQLPAEPQSTEAVQSPEATQTPAVKTVDYAALYATHQPDEVVFRFGDSEMTWQDYFYWLHYYGQQVEDYFTAMASYYGTEGNWSDKVDNTDVTYAQYVVESASGTGKQMATLEGFAEENGVTLTEENEKAIAEQLKSDISGYCGEGATEEDFFTAMAETYMTRELYERMNRVNYLYQNGFTALYGENGSLVDDADALSYLKDNGYIRANHILFMTVNAETGEALSDEEKAEKKAAAESVAAELKAIKDSKALEEKFLELKEQYCEDTGKALYPQGYTFLPGAMVEQFETACNALEEYALSDVIETTYGYHVILRLPLSADSVVQYSDQNTPMTGRSLMANEEYGQRVQAYQDALTVEQVNGFETPDLLDYIK